MKKSKDNSTLIGLGVFAAIAVVLCLAVVFLKDKDETFEENLLGINYEIEGNDTDLKYDKKNPVVSMYIENYGSVVMELYPEHAPNTVNNFISLVKSGYYDNNTFHRLVPGFVLQGGDPTGTGIGGPGYSIRGEFASNAVMNNLQHTKGIVSMARASDPNSAGGQFFIMLDDNSGLDGSYAAFGEVIDGMDMIEEIEKRERVADEDSGQLANNLIIKKALVDLNDYEYHEPEIIEDVSSDDYDGE